MCRVILLACAILLTLAMPTLYAAEPISLRTLSFSELQDNFQLILPGMKHQNYAVAKDTLIFVREHTDDNNVTHIRMQQQYAGFPVFGGYAIMHSEQHARTLRSAKDNVKMNGFIYRGLNEELGQPSSTFIARAKLALQRFKSLYPVGSISEARVTPMVYVDDRDRAFWAYRVSILIQYDDKIPERPTAIINATTLEPFIQWNDIKTGLSSVNGAGFGGNFRTGIHQFGDKFKLLSLSRDDKSAMCYMVNPEVKVVDMAHKMDDFSEPMQFSCLKSTPKYANAYWTGYKSDGYDLENGAYSPTNDALYIGYVIYHMYKDWYGLYVLTEKEEPMQLVMRVHFGKSYSNAFWDGRQMTFGDGDSNLYPLVSIGIGAHEISHGFTEQHAGFDYFGQSGGMDESFSDMAAQTAEYYAIGKSSWTIGSEIIKELNSDQALRFMDVPSRDGRSIDTADQYYEGLDVHYSSGVYNRLFYLLSTRPGWDPRKTFEVMIKANMDYWTPNSTFEEGGCGVISAAEDLKYSVSTVKQALDQVAINYQECG